MKTEKTFCDSCGTEKKESNHWFKIVQNMEVNGDLLIIPARSFKEPNTKQVVDVCGEKCVLVMVARWMETGSTHA